MHTTLNMLLRLPRHGETIETIARLHKDVIDRYQTVWLGILGRKYSAANIESIRKEGEYLYIVQMQVEGRPTLFKGRIATSGTAYQKTSITWPQRITTLLGSLGVRNCGSDFHLLKAPPEQS